MPVWTPGSYLIREYAKNVDEVKVENANSEKIRVKKINKNSWSVDSKGQNHLKFKYRVYCNEFTVRTSTVNNEHAFLSGAGTFMYVKGFEDKKCILKINPPPEWKKISTGLNKVTKNTYYADNYDNLIDSPVEIGNQKVHEFEIKGIKHFICLYGKGNYKDDIIINDFKKIAEEEIKLFDSEIPYKDYTFIIHLVEKGGGGLEHLNSFVAQINRWSFGDDKLYKKFLGLVSHEFFHLWNVKRIRPETLGPFNYNIENYTESLWIAEGWTSFYDNLFLRRCNIIDNKEYFEFVDVEVNDIMRFKGRFSQSLAESSMDTWIKFYRKDENYSNSQVSYYTKGALVALMLNIEIITATNAARSLDDVMRMLYRNYKEDSTKGYTDKSVKEASESVGGIDLNDFWEKYVYGVEDLPINEYLNRCGLKLINEKSEVQCALDIETKNDNGRYIVTKLYAGGSAYESGMNFNDEIIAVNGTRVDIKLMDKILENCKTEEVIEVLINRGGIINTIPVKLLTPIPKYKIEEAECKNEDQQKFLNKWLTGN